ncbi:MULTISPECIES: hypothetical protein [unclassified Streptomyces]|uniref:hypothetical protein n=1 Tax=unclassified Streptomyces TaxID=2593676 RepID=UPI002E2AC1D1|nr:MULTISPECIES: hypothetical protein [unclassified Streptomyces]
MRARMLLTSVALGATVLMGGTAAAQATPSLSQADEARTVAPSYVKYMGTFTKAGCEARRDSYAGSAYCEFRGTNKYALYILVP